MISNPIDASPTGGGSQLLDLLAVVAKPEVYAAKIADLEAKTAEYRKIVEAVGPASEIEALRAQAQVAADEAQAALSKAKQEAAAILSEAKAEAAELQREAKVKADATIKRAKDREGEAELALASAQAEASAARTLMDGAAAAKGKADAEAEAATAERSELAKARREVDDVREAIISKHRAFIEGL